MLKIPTFNTNTGQWEERILPESEETKLVEQKQLLEKQRQLTMIKIARIKEYDALGWPSGLEPLLDYLSSFPDREPNDILREMIQQRLAIKAKYPKPQE